MHEMLYEQKRAYWTVQGRLRRFLRRFGLTPARLEVLRFILMGYTSQPRLRRALGVASSTMSRMLSTMEKRGLVVRSASAPQRAKKSISVPEKIAGVAQRALGFLQPLMIGQLNRILGRTPREGALYIDAAHRAMCLLTHTRQVMGDRAYREDDEVRARREVKLPRPRRRSLPRPDAWRDDATPIW